MASVSATLQPENMAYFVNNIRFELEAAGYATIWFDLGGPAFSEPEAMTNMFVEFEPFLEDLKRMQPAFRETLAGEGDIHHSTLLERLEAADFDWEGCLHSYIDRHINLYEAEQERVRWLLARRARAAKTAQQQMEDDWVRLSAEAEISPFPTWDDVAHSIIDSLNATAVKLYPELLDYDADGNSRLRDMIESHGERLANQLVALTRDVRKNRIP